MPARSSAYPVPGLGVQRLQFLDEEAHLGRQVALLRIHGHEPAPHAGLIVHALSADFDYAAALESGALDLVIGNWPEQAQHLHLAQLFEDELVCMLNSEHPVVQKGLSLKYCLDMTHLAPTPYMMGHRSIIDSALAEPGLKRKIQMTIPCFGMVPYVLAQTDMVFTTSRCFARHFSRQWPKMRFFMLWHERAHAAPEVQWLRKLVAGASREVMAGEAPDGRVQDSQ